MALLPPVIDEEDGFTLYPVRHALGAIVYSFTPESQKLWQDLADKQAAELDAWMQRRIISRKTACLSN